MRTFSRKAIIILLILFIFITIECYAWTWPLSEILFTSEYGPNNAGSPWYRFHHGIDIDAELSDPVYSALTGHVFDFGYQSGGAGYFIKVANADESIIICYFHLDEYITFAPSDPITEGQLIGYAGETGNAQGVHLHFEFREDVDNQDHSVHPLKYMPYYDCYLLGCELVENLDIDFTIQLTIATDELDIDILDFYIYYTDGDSYYDEILSVDYSEKQNIPLINNDNDIIVLNNHWEMTVTPEYWTPGEDDEYTITFNFQPNQPGVKAYTVEADIYAANGSWDGDLYETVLVPTNSIDPGSQIVAKNTIISCYPNPFCPKTAGNTILYNLSQKIENPQILIYNIRGQKVKSLPLCNQPGEAAVTWDGTNMHEQKVSSGIYLYRMINNGKDVDTKKILLLNK